MQFGSLKQTINKFYSYIKSFSSLQHIKGGIEKEYVQFYSDGKMGISDEFGNIIIPAQYDFIEMMSDGLFSVQKEGFTAYFNDVGKVVLPFQNKYDSYGNFTEGLARVRKNERWGYINKSAKEVIPPRFYFAEEFSNGRAVIRNEEGLHGVINRNGEIVIDYGFILLSKFENGYAKFGDLNKWGLMDKDGNIVLAPIYFHIGNVEKGKAKVQIKDGEDYKEGMFTIGGGIEWNNNLDDVNKLNRKAEKFKEAIENLIETLYSDGCPCEFERIRNYIEWSRPVNFVDQEILFLLFAKKLQNLSTNEFECLHCGTKYVQKWEQYSVFLWVLNVSIKDLGQITEKGAALLPIIPVALGFRGYKLEGLNEKYYETSVEKVIEYWQEKI